MPLYEYECPECGAVFEVLSKSNSEEEMLCTECGTPLVKQISVSTFRLNGEGWTPKFYN